MRQLHDATLAAAEQAEWNNTSLISGSVGEEADIIRAPQSCNLQQGAWRRRDESA